MPADDGTVLAYVEEVLSVDGLLMLVVWKVLSDAAVRHR